jgi:uncharacterized circularly permuted ATP-grasp superfamily protein
VLKNIATHRIILYITVQSLSNILHATEGEQNKIFSRCAVKGISKKKSRVSYNPNLGFIGNAEVKVANYLFSAKRMRKAYNHAKPVADRILKKEVSTHYHESKRLTKFLKNRDLTFSKKTSSGEYKEFVVPCTTTVVPLQKSLFNEVEEASQRLIIALRKVIQDIYGSTDLRSSKFVKSLPKNVRDIFVQAIESSASYYPQLHHPNMKNYPFLDNVGLDLVLVEDYLQKSDDFPGLIAKNKEEELPGLPFRILELNAGSPSGASNNMNMLEGMYDQTPEILDNLGKMMPNDHFKVLGETYKSLGEYWTKRKDGIQILLPPGGQNGAAPEIHQLAAYSGLIYADPDQLYQDEEGYIRLRTVEENPIVNAIYSRVNSDSALFDPKKGLILRDPDSGEPIYLTDTLRLNKDGKAEVVKDANGNPVPLQSAYAIPGSIEAIVNRKLYMGGLNRILDNKIILATLTHYAPRFYAKEITKKGLDPKGTKIMPPQTLPPTKESADIICNNPDEWVVKAPSLAGGQGVYILKTLPKAKKEEVLEMIQERPEEFAYQQLVKIGRIPVAVHRKEEGYRFANLAADIRIWVFYGAGKNAMPKMTHNALVRYAPQERGKMSSIVNTSAGGGYAPFVIIDDTNNPEAVTAEELTKPKVPVKMSSPVPVFVGAQMVQISRMLKEMNELIATDKTSAYELLGMAIGLKLQLKEVLSFLHPRVIEKIYKVIDILEAKLPKAELAEYFLTISNNQVDVVQTLKKVEDRLPEGFMDIIDNIRALNMDTINTFYTEEDRALDMVMIDELRVTLKDANLQDASLKRKLQKLIRTIKSSVEADAPMHILTTRTKNTLLKLLNEFCEGSQKRLLASPLASEFAKLFDLNANVTSLRFETLYLGRRDVDKEIRVASQFEMRTGERISESAYIPAHMQEARQEWLKIQAAACELTDIDKHNYLEEKRREHFAKFPFLARYQFLLNKRNISINELIELLPVAPYAKFNIEHFAREKGLSIREVFSNNLEQDKISILSSDELKRLKLCSRNHAGECFAKKRQSHGLYSNSDIFIWLRAELDPFTMLYTAGHELIHYQQLRHSMSAEERALKDGGLSLAKFLNYYGNFLGANRRTIDSINFNMQAERKPLYGYVDRCIKDFTKPVISELRNALQQGDDQWSNTLDKYGSLFGYMMPTSAATKVKALQEVLPALENAKNITFAQELGLDIRMDAVKSAMPTANECQVETYRNDILRAVRSADAQWEALRVIASHQFHGIMFSRADKDEQNLLLKPIVTTVAVGSSYNQTQQ